MHKETLCKNSPYFKAALEGNFKEARKRVIEMPEDNVEVFQVFRTWLYTGGFQLVEDSCNHTWKTLSWEILVGLYIFGECRLIRELLNPVMDLLIKKPEAPIEVPVHLAPYIYENTCDISRLRQWIRNATAYAAAVTKLDKNPAKFFIGFPLEFCRDLSEALKYVGNHGCGNGLISISNKCKYHVLDRDGYCHRSKVVGDCHRWTSKEQLSLNQPDGGPIG
jgi:hypothetical protein